MSNRLSAEYASKVCAPEVFDTAFEKGDILVSDALACSTMGLTRFIQDVRGLEPDASHFLETIPVTSTKARLLPMRRAHISRSASALGLIRDNRIFGYGSGEKDVLWSEHPDRASYIERTGYSWEGFMTPDDGGYGFCQLLEASCGAEEVQRMAQLALSRQGVQVIYGGEGMLSVLQSGAAPDDNHPTTAWKREQRMPTEFVTAILPLGEYERAELLTT